MILRSRASVRGRSGRALSLIHRPSRGGQLRLRLWSRRVSDADAHAPDGERMQDQNYSAGTAVVRRPMEAPLAAVTPAHGSRLTQSVHAGGGADGALACSEDEALQVLDEITVSSRGLLRQSRPLPMTFSTFASNWRLRIEQCNVVASPESADADPRPVVK